MHEDLTSYDCIVIIITVYPHNLNIKLEKVKKKIKKLVSTPTHPTILPFVEERERERENIVYIIWLLVYLYTYFVSIIYFYRITYLFFIIGTEGKVYCVRMYHCS
jgi:hypothetical protein